MFINQEVDLPEPLVAAQRDGKLVVFAGAGVSMGPPSNLPNFTKLTEQVGAGVLERRHREPLDAYLGRLESHGVDVQARTRSIIGNPDSRPKPIHERIIRLFRDEESVRLITTNFDPHFTTVLRPIYPGLEIFVGPALPLGRDLMGAVYLHGAVEKPKSRLVLTDSDFGRAYLADGWATRFLMEVFNHFTVLFVGYSHEDVVMQYLARSFAGPTPRFALTPTGKDDFWSNLGIMPVHFPIREPPAQEYGAIDDALENWSARARMGILDHGVRIAQLVDTAPALDLELADYMRVVLRDHVTLKLFIERAARIEWFQWVEAEGFLKPLTATAPLTIEARLWATWIAEHFAIEHPRTVLDFVRRHSATINPSFCEAVALRIVFVREGLSADTVRVWAAALLAAATTPADALTRLLKRCADLGDVSTTALLFRSLLRPQLAFEPPWPGDHDEPLRIPARISLRGEAHTLQEVWASRLLPNLPAIYRELLPTITAYLIDASALLIAAGRAGVTWDPMSYRRSAIELHEQDHIPEDWGLLIDVARDLIDWLATNEPALARSTVDAWSAASQPLLVRLAIYAIGRASGIAPDDALAIIEQHGWLYKLTFKHEVFEFLRRVFPHASEPAQRQFIEHSMTALVVPADKLETDPHARDVQDYERYNVAMWLRQIAPESTVAAAHFEQRQAEHPSFAPRKHPDMDHWISAGFVGPNSPKTAEDLLAMAPVDAAAYVESYEPDIITFRGPDRHGLLTVFQQAAATDGAWSLAVADALATQQLWKTDVWEAILGAWRTAPLTDDAWDHVGRLINDHAAVITAAPGGAARAIERAMDREDLALPDIQRLEETGERIVPVADAEDAGVWRGDGSVDWLTSAINHPAGNIAECWLKALRRRIALAGDAWDGLPQEVRLRFERLLMGPGNSAVMGRIIFASQTQFLFAADRRWTEENIIPLFDWTADATRAAQAWEGFLWHPRWNDPLFERMQEFVRQTFTRLDELDEQDVFVSALASVAAFSNGDAWHHHAWLFEFMRVAAANHRAQWAQEFGRYIESLTADGTDILWTRWLAQYWDDRLTGVPVSLAEEERQVIITWVPALRSKLALLVTRITARPPTTLSHLTFHRLHQAGIATTSGREFGRLLRELFPHLQRIEYDFGEVAQLANEAADHGADPADLLVVAAHMARLQCSGAAALRDRLNG